jgi:hypothetical protein
MKTWLRLRSRQPIKAGSLVAPEASKTSYNMLYQHFELDLKP